MTDAEIFHQELGLYGGRLPSNQLEPAVAALFDNQAKAARNYIASASEILPKMPPVYFDFVANNEINAWASHIVEGRHLIGVSGGSFCIFLLIFNRMLADPRVLKHVGDPMRELPDLPLLAGFAANVHQMFSLGHRPTVPQDPARRHYADHLIGITFSYLVGHELTHITNGHTGLWKAYKHLPAIAELGCRPQNAAESIMRQTMEMDADCGVVSNQIGTIRAKITGTKPASPPWDMYYRDPEQAFFDWAFAICTYFRLFGDQPFAGADFDSLTHPPDRVRQNMMLATGDEYIRVRWDAGLSEVYGEAFSRAIAEVERAFPMITGEPRAIEGLRDAASPEANAYVSRLLAYWKSDPRAALSKYAYGNLPD